VFLTEANVLHYLIERRFAGLDTVVDGDFEVRSLSHRNRCLRIACGTREYLVKQPSVWNRSRRASLAREAALYWQGKTDSAFAALMPQCWSWDPGNSILILEFLPGYTDLYSSPARLAPSIATLAGQAMGKFHEASSRESHEREFPGEIPWFISMHQHHEDDLPDMNPGRRELLKVVKKHTEFTTEMDRLREEWQPSSLIHSDWKLANCLISPDRSRLSLVDWEFAGWGDPYWDAGTMLQSYWSFWVRWPSLHSVDEVCPVLRAFLSAWARTRGLSLFDCASTAIRFAAIRMLQTAWEVLDKSDEISAEAVRLTQASLNILTRTGWAMGQLLGVGAACARN
jgi:hypothetical protein